jgi:glyoxylase-like metal-dependent hydrolase (beta-lactamase superfamily II)
MLMKYKGRYSRRQFISHTGNMLAFAATQPRQVLAQTPPATRTRLILLGTGGGPRPRKNSFPSSQVILINKAAYVIDCGNGVAIQLARAGVPLPTLRHVSITHHHSDHNADYGNLLLLAWASGFAKPGGYVGVAAFDTDDSIVLRDERLRHQNANCGRRQDAPDDPDITDQMWLDRARSNFKGQIILGKDLLEI